MGGVAQKTGYKGKKFTVEKWLYKNHDYSKMDICSGINTFIIEYLLLCVFVANHFSCSGRPR